MNDGRSAFARRVAGLRVMLPLMTEPDDWEVPWESLFEEADAIVKGIQESLPEPLQEEAARVPCLLEKWPPEGDEALGRCLSFEEKVISEAPGPIVLYIGAIYMECEETGADFAEEVRITYLHELGHHLGLDEDDLAQRGLE